MSPEKPDFANMQCPLSFKDYPTVTLAHGGGGKLTHQLLEKIFLPLFQNSHLKEQHDGASLAWGKERVAFTTDGYVVHPLFFPGGDIGRMAILGTANDLAMCGAKPQYISVALIMEEGLPMETLWSIAQSMKRAADEAGIEVVTGDTKVVDRGKGDGIYITTAGVGAIPEGVSIKPAHVKPGDHIVLSGDVGRHGMAVMAVRENLDFDSVIESDLAPLSPVVQKLIAENLPIHCLRDLTRGGLASSLNEIAAASGTSILVEEAKIPVREDVRGACEILGFDPLYVACEGRFIAFVPPEAAPQTLSILKSMSPGDVEPAVIGEVREGFPGQVTLMTSLGTKRLLDLLTGSQLPRIC